MSLKKTKNKKVAAAADRVQEGDQAGSLGTVPFEQRTHALDNVN